MSIFCILKRSCSRVNCSIFFDDLHCTFSCCRILCSVNCYGFDLLYIRSYILCCISFCCYKCCTFTVKYNRYSFCCQFKICRKIRIFSGFIRYFQSIFAYLSAFCLIGKYPVFYLNILKTFNCIFCLIITRKSFYSYIYFSTFNICILCCDSPIEFNRHILICINLIDSIICVICDFIDCLTHHLFIIF